MTPWPSSTVPCFSRCQRSSRSPCQPMLRRSRGDHGEVPPGCVAVEQVSLARPHSDGDGAEGHRPLLVVACPGWDELLHSGSRPRPTGAPRPERLAGPGSCRASTRFRGWPGPWRSATRPCRRKQQTGCQLRPPRSAHPHRTAPSPPAASAWSGPRAARRRRPEGSRGWCTRPARCRRGTHHHPAVEQQTPCSAQSAICG